MLRTYCERCGAELRPDDFILIGDNAKRSKYIDDPVSQNGDVFLIRKICCGYCLTCVELRVPIIAKSNTKDILPLLFDADQKKDIHPGEVLVPCPICGAYVELHWCGACVRRIRPTGGSYSGLTAGGVYDDELGFPLRSFFDDEEIAELRWVFRGDCKEITCDLIELRMHCKHCERDSVYKFDPPVMITLPLDKDSAHRIARAIREGKYEVR